MAICETHGIDHEDPKQQTKLYRTLQRRYYFFMTAFLASVAAGCYGAYLLGGLGGLICATAAFLIHFFYPNMGYSGQAYMEMKFSMGSQKTHLHLVPPPTKPSGTYV